MDVFSEISYADFAATPLAEALGEADATAVAAQLTRRDLAAGEVLFQQGDPSTALFLVLRGRLSAEIAGEGSARQRLGEIGPGELVGEVGLLLGVPRGAAVQALDPTTLAALSSSSWQLLSGSLPMLKAAVKRAVEWRERTTQTRRFRPDAAWITAWLDQAGGFGGADSRTLAALSSELMWETLPAGEILVREGDPGACMWFLVSGRLRAAARQADGTVRTVGDVVVGESVGEMALLSDAPRAATVKAVRDSELLRLPRIAFDRLARTHGDVMLRLARSIVGRLRQTLRGAPVQLGERTVALIAGHPDVRLAAFAATLHLECARLAPSVLLDGTAATRLKASAVSNPELVLLVCDETATAWTAQAFRQADDIVIVGRADGDVQPGPLEREALDAAARRDATCHLVLLHENQGTASGTSRWLAARPAVRHHHVHSNDARDSARLARRLSNRAIGLALSGGGARGFAHIGVIRALHEAGVPIDMVAGTSMGAMVAAVYALGYTPAAMLDRCRAWTREHPWTDFTLPIASIVSGRRVRRALTTLLGPGRIEDTWLPFACVTSNLTKATTDAHTAGPLVELVLASNSVPGLAPPVFYQGDVQVDGGLMDNLPAATLRQMGAGRVIAVDVSTETGVSAPAGVDVCPSGWALLWDRMRKRPTRAPAVFATLTRAFTLASDERTHAAGRDADLTMRPLLDRYASSDFDEIDAIAEIGYSCARDALARSTRIDGTRP